MAPIRAIGFDADDTLWHNERFFKLTEARFAELLRDYAAPDHLAERLLAAERRNLGRYGFGIKGFVLSMIETAMDVTDDRVPATVLRRIVEAGHDMLEHPIELLPSVQDTVADLHGRYTLILITKGDLLDQERKLAQSGLGDWFDGIEIVSDKTPDIYIRAFAPHGGARAGLMVGNSMKSDVLPMIAAGGIGVHVPHGQEWALEAAEPPKDEARFHALENLSALPDLVRHLGD
ncbi:putative hydrolase of the HAD superfamily [Palleronia salina]|uniref:Putative hydrolase of the HAD superfamily n=1 Tax=Palleronia salina TaxID=313368 RepID=A0A1M6EQZ5_9RHOB|nr:HAD family hydrolase [Palleronia salina]SHI87885.1 putative hydrolase of the HAD superfamily [Palleronia salina]